MVGNLLLARRDWVELKQLSNETIALSEKYGHEDGLLLSTQFQLIASCMLGDDVSALPSLCALMEQERATGCTGRNLISGHVHAAEAAIQAGQLDLAQHLNALATLLMEERGMRAWEPEVWRVRAELLLAQDPANTQEAEDCLQRALAISRSRKGRSLELRAALSLARLRVSQNRARDAVALIQPVYDRFTQGFETLDLVQAKAMLLTKI